MQFGLIKISWVVFKRTQVCQKTCLNTRYNTCITENPT